MSQLAPLGSKTRPCLTLKMFILEHFYNSFVRMVSKSYQIGKFVTKLKPLVTSIYSFSHTYLYTISIFLSWCEQNDPNLKTISKDLSDNSHQFSHGSPLELSPRTLLHFFSYEYKNYFILKFVSIYIYRYMGGGISAPIWLSECSIPDENWYTQV